MSGQLIPNTFQHPNAYVDWLSYYLTPEEEKVLNKAVREILGWQDKIANRQARIALSVFVSGKVINGQQVCMGCGLSLDTVRKALASLHSFNVLVKIGAPTNDGQMYELVETWDDIKWDAIRLRRDTWDEQNKKRTKAARESQQEGVMSDSRQGSCRTVGQGVMSDSNKETQASLETQKEKPAAPIPKKPFSPLPIDDNYQVKYYYKDKGVVRAIGTVSRGPWAVECYSCGSEVVIAKLNSEVPCLCGNHEFVLISERPTAKVKMHPAVLVLRKKVGNRKLNDEQIGLVESIVGTDEKDLDFWRQVIEGWLQHGWYEGNIKGMVDWYSKREIPNTKPGKKQEKRTGETTHTPLPPPAHPQPELPEMTPEEEEAEMRRVQGWIDRAGLRNAQP